jgi:ABC-2 family transporter protein
MVMRLWWKDARQFWPIGALLVVFGGVIQVLVLRYGGDDARHGSFVFLAFLWTSLYAFAVTAAAFAGERESRTLVLLDTFAVGRWQLWGAKTVFAVVSTAILAVVMLAMAAISTSSLAIAPYRWPVGLLIGMLILLEVLGWGMFFSSLLKNPLTAAILAIVAVTAVTPMLRRDGMYTMENEVNGAPIRLAVALATLAASALILTRGGPPVRSSGESRTVRFSRAFGDAKPARHRFWPHAVRSLFWETMRSSGPILGSCAGFALVCSLLSAFLWNGMAWLLMYVGTLFIGLMGGVSTFNIENRSRTRLFLAHHGVRPGVIWMVKLGVWLACLGLFLWLPALILAAVWQYLGAGSLSGGAVNLPLAVAAMLTAGFALGQFCGMTIHRGITAFTAAVMLFIVFVIPIGALSGVNMISPLFVVLIAGGFLFITWAWSGDWLLSQPGAGKWVRLGVLAATTSAAWFAAYTADRAWGIPRLSADSEASIAQLTAPAFRKVPANENAAELYRQAAAKLMAAGARSGDSVEGMKEVAKVVRDGWDEKANRAIEWLKAYPEALELTRKAAEKPFCQFNRFDRATVNDQKLDFVNVPMLRDLVAVSAREALSRGDLAASWADIVTLFHMAGHCTGPVAPTLEYWGLFIERDALRLAMQWAANPAQTSKSLRDALQSCQEIPTPLIGEALAVDLALVRNTLAKPHADVVVEAASLFWGGRNGPDRDNPMYSLALHGMTTPWEIERARRQSDQNASESIEYALNDPYNRPWQSDNPPRNVRGTRWHPAHFPKEPVSSEGATPLVRLITSRSVSDSFIRLNDRNEVARRALRIILRLRVYQAEHDGNLPRGLALIEPPVTGREITDPYSGVAFDYIRSNGQILAPLGHFEPLATRSANEDLVSTKGCMLLFSVGPDFLNNYASVNDTFDDKQGDIVFPIRDNVPPPSKPENPTTNKD